MATSKEMYAYSNMLLEKIKKKVRVEFNRLDVMGFDELNSISKVRAVTEAMYDRLSDYNREMYLKAAQKAYKAAVDECEAKGFTISPKQHVPSSEWLDGVLSAYVLATGYLYNKEVDRKRMRLTEQILTNREFDNRENYHRDMRRNANLWYSQSSQYMIETVDQATMDAYEDCGVEYIKWVTEHDDRVCGECDSLDGQIFLLEDVPDKPHPNCRCSKTPITPEEFDREVANRNREKTR